MQQDRHAAKLAQRRVCWHRKFRPVLLSFVLASAACGGGSGGGTPSVPVPDPVSVSGTVTFDLVPPSSTGNGLDYTATIAAPVRGAVVQALSASGGAVLGETTTSATGTYTLSVPGATSVRVRVRARLLRNGAPSWNVTVVDNTSGDAAYVLDGTAFDSGSGVADRNLHAPSGWDGSDYSATRAAGPFAILDAVHDAIDTILAVDADAQFPPLVVKWSTLNVPTPGNESAGQIATTFYRRDGSGSQIFVLGAEDNDTDEYDRHILLHEWGHFFEDAFSRSDSVGGQHSGGDRLDPRVAFSEGWGYAFAGIAAGDPVTRDTAGNNQQLGFSIDVERNDNVNPGWYSEGSIQSIIYDLIDDSDDGVDALSLGLGPVYEVLVTTQRDSRALTTLFGFVAALRQSVAGSAPAIDAIVAAQDIDATAIDAFGSGESNDAGNSQDVLPIYTPLTANGPAAVVCSIGGAGAFGVSNKLSNRRFLVADLPAAGAYRITANGPAGSDPDIVIHQAGIVETAEGVVDGAETITLSLAVGTMVVEVYEFTNVTPSPTARGRTCFSVDLVRL